MIKKLDKNNWQELKKIRLEALKKSPESFLSSFEEENKITDNIWIEKLENSSQFGYFINDEIVGLAGLLIEKVAKISHVGTLFSMYVKDDLRGDGIGLALVSFIKRLCKAKQCKAFISRL